MSSLRTAIFLLYLMCCGSGAALKYFIEDQDSWLNQTRPPCTLATPDINFSASNGNSVDFPGNLTLETGAGFIVGYIRTLKVFKYIGCISKYELWAVLMVHRDIPSDPGQCYSKCGGSYKFFGILQTTCYCLESKLSQRSISCTSECSSPKSTVCGGQYGTYISVYEYVDEMAGQSDGNFCLAVNTHSQHFFWGNCGGKRNGMCQNRSGGSLPSLVPCTWKDYVNICFSQHSFPLIEKHVPILNIDGEQDMWTGLIRSWVIEKSIGTPAADTNYGYVTHEGGSYRLRFSKNGNLAMKFLCFGDEPDKKPFTQLYSNPISSVFTTTTYKQTKAKETTAYPNKQTPAEPSSAFINNGKSIVEEKTRASAMIAVYVVSPCVVIVVVAVGTICFIRRGRRNNDAANIDTELSSENSKPTNGVNSAAYDRDSIPSGSEQVSEHVYWVLESATDHADNDVHENDDDYDTTTTMHTRVNTGNDRDVYNTLEASTDDTYDHTVDIINKIKHNNDNDGDVYNTLEASPDDTYDHTVDISNKMKNNYNNDGDVYNTLEASTDDTYNHTGDITAKIKIIDETYNHAVKKCDIENE